MRMVLHYVYIIPLRMKYCTLIESYLSFYKANEAIGQKNLPEIWKGYKTRMGAKFASGSHSAS